MAQPMDGEISGQFEKFSYSVTVSVLNVTMSCCKYMREKAPSSVLLEEGIRDVIAGKRVNFRR
jgi:hypothetical protein